MDVRSAMEETVALARDHGMPGDPKHHLRLEHLEGMVQRMMADPEMSNAKLNRWLGYAQGVVAARCYAVTLDTLKDINRRHSIFPEDE